jgi:hypothetical protein
VGGLFGLCLCWLRLELGAGYLRFFDRPLRGGDLRFFDRPLQGIWELRMLFQLRRVLQLLFRHIQQQRGVHGHDFTFRRADKLCLLHRIWLRQVDRERRSIQWLDGPQRRGGLVDELVVGLFHGAFRLEDLHDPAAAAAATAM